MLTVFVGGGGGGGSFSYTSHAGFIFLWAVSITQPMLAFFSFFFLLFFFFLIWGVSLTHPVLSLSYFYVGSFSYRSHVCFISLWRVSLTHPMLAFLCVCGGGGGGEWGGGSLTHPVLTSFLSGEFLLCIPYWLHFYLARFSYTSRAGFIIIWGASPKHAVSLPHPVLASFLCGEFLLHILCWLLFFIRRVSLKHPVLGSF